MSSEQLATKALVQSKQHLLDFLKGHTVFKVLDERVLAAISQLFEEQHFRPGQVVFHEGDKADALYIILDGAVSVLQGKDQPKLVANLSVGDIFGEMAAYNESRRTATISVTEESTILKLPIKAFNELQTYFPEVTKEIVSLITKRLDRTSPTEAAGLKGDLSLFDLPTVIQTVVSSRQTGTLTLTTRVGKLSARITAKNGRIMQVGFGHLNGEHAWYELLTHTEPMEFVFEPEPEESIVSIDQNLSSKEPHLLLLEAARRVDELPGLMKKLDWPDMIYLQNTQQTVWKSFKGDGDVARKIWFLLEVGLSISQIAEKLPFDRYTVLTNMEELLNQQLIRRKAAPSASKTTQASPPPQPVALKVVTILNGINSVVTSMAQLLGRGQVAKLLQDALAESIAQNDALKCLSVNAERQSLELNNSLLNEDNLDKFLKGSEQLFYTFLYLTAQKYKPQGK